MSDTTTYKLYIYIDQRAPGVDFQCETQNFSDLATARLAEQDVVRRPDVTFYEIQSISTTKSQGSISANKTILNRTSLRRSQWSTKI